MFYKLSNAGLRMASLGIKMLFMLYMGKYLGLYDLGTYGLVAAIVALSIPLLGMQLEYVISREIIGENDEHQAILLKDELIFYMSNYGFLIFGCIILWPVLADSFDSSIIIYTLILCILEGISTLATATLTSLQRPIIGNIVFFIRSSLWVIPVVILGLIDETYRNVDIIFQFWIGGALLSLVFAAFILKYLPWIKAFQAKTDWRRILKNVKKALPLWGAAVCLAGATYLDRFVVESFLDREFVGIISFYSAFIVAIAALTGSSVFSFSYPRMIALHKDGNHAELYALTKSTTIQAGIWALGLSLIIGLFIPVLGEMIGRPEFATYKAVFYIMLLGVVIRTTTQSLQFLSYAQHDDWVVWTGNLVFLLSSLCSALILIPLLGFIGAGYSAIISALCLSLWRLYYMKPEPAAPA